MLLNFMAITPKMASLTIARVHFGFSTDPVRKNDGDLFNFEFFEIGPILHLYLEGISNKSHFVKINAFQNPPIITYKTRCGIVYLHSGNELYIKRGSIGQ